MKISEHGLRTLTQAFEQCRLTAYQDSKGVWTIGWGHTGKDVRPGSYITQERADELLKQDILYAQIAVQRYVKVPLTQDEFDALTDFAYNIGVGAFAGSTLLLLLNKGDYHGAAAQFGYWDKSGGKVLAGLLRRRAAERDTFLTGATA